MNKRKILLRNIRQGQSQYKKIIIGVIGASLGVGVTHTCIMLAQYLRQQYAGSVAVVELNGQNDYSSLYEERFGTDLEENGAGFFSLDGVSYYFNQRDSAIARILNEDYTYVILDLGSNLRKYTNELLRCNIKLLIGSLMYWKRKSMKIMLDFCSQYQGYQDWFCLANFSDKGVIKEIKKEYSVSIYPMEYVPNPFQLPIQAVELFRTIL